MKLTSSAKEGKTTLDLEISRFVSIIVTLALATVVVCMLVWALWLRKQHHSYLNLPEMLANVIGLAVAFIPEGLPGAVPHPPTHPPTHMKIIAGIAHIILGHTACVYVLHGGLGPRRLARRR